MQLPWNRKYNIILFYTLLTLCIILILILVIYTIVYQRNTIVQALQNLLSAISPIIWSFAITILLEPLVAFWQARYIAILSKHHKSTPSTRRFAVAISYGLVVLFFAILIWIAVYFFGNSNLSDLATQTSFFLQKISDWLILLQLKLMELGVLQNAENMFSTFFTRFGEQIQSFFLSLAQTLPTFGSQILHILIGLTAAFYFLSEKTKLQQTFYQISDTFFGTHCTQNLCLICKELYRIWIGYLNGQFFDALIMSILFSFTFWLIGIPYGIGIGLLSGFSNFIPYLGAVVAFCLALLSGLFSDAPIRALYAAIAILLLQQLDSAIIIPRILGERVALHPVLVLFSLAVFGGLFGFWGLLFAVPLGAVCKSLFDWAYKRKQRKNQTM